MNVGLVFGSTVFFVTSSFAFVTFVFALSQVHDGKLIFPKTADPRAPVAPGTFPGA